MNKSSLQTRCCANDTLGNFSDAARNYIENTVRITNISMRNDVEIKHLQLLLVRHYVISL